MASVYHILKPSLDKQSHIPFTAGNEHKLNKLLSDRKGDRKQTVHNALVELVANMFDFVKPVLDTPGVELQPFPPEAPTEWRFVYKTQIFAIIRVYKNKIVLEQVGPMLPLGAIHFTENTSGTAGPNRTGGFGIGLKDAAVWLTNHKCTLSLEFVPLTDAEKKSAAGGGWLSWSGGSASGGGRGAIVCTAKAKKVDGAANREEVVMVVSELQKDRFRDQGFAVVHSTLPLMRVIVKLPDDLDAEEMVCGVLGRFEALYEVLTLPRSAEEVAAYGAKRMRYDHRFLNRGDKSAQALRREAEELLFDASLRTDLLDGHDVGSLNDKYMYLPKVFFSKHRLKMPEGQVVMVGGVITATNTQGASSRCVIRVPGRGLPGDLYPVVSNHLREPNWNNLWRIFERILLWFLNSMSKLDNAEQEKWRKQFCPLLTGDRGGFVVDGAACSHLNSFLTAHGEHNITVPNRWPALRRMVCGEQTILASADLIRQARYLASLLPGAMAKEVDYTRCNPHLFKLSPDLKEHEKNVALAASKKRTGNLLTKARANDPILPVLARISYTPRNDLYFFMHDVVSADAQPYSFRVVSKDQQLSTFVVCHDQDPIHMAKEALPLCDNPNGERARMMKVWGELAMLTKPGQGGIPYKKVMDRLRAVPFDSKLASSGRVQMVELEPENRKRPRPWETAKPKAHGKVIQMTGTSMPPTEDPEYEDSDFRLVFHGPSNFYLQPGYEAPTLATIVNMKAMSTEAIGYALSTLGVERVMPDRIHFAWGPDLPWKGCNWRKDIYLNMAKLKTDGEVKATLVHELAHDESGAHDVVFASAMGKMLGKML